MISKEEVRKLVRNRHKEFRSKREKTSKIICEHILSLITEISPNKIFLFNELKSEPVISSLKNELINANITLYLPAYSDSWQITKINSTTKYKTEKLSR